MSVLKVRYTIFKDIIFKKVSTAVLKAVEKFKLIDNIIMNSDYQDATAHPLWSEWEHYAYVLVEQGWGYLIRRYNHGKEKFKQLHYE